MYVYKCMYMSIKHVYADQVAQKIVYSDRKLRSCNSNWPSRKKRRDAQYAREMRWNIFCFKTSRMCFINFTTKFMI